MFITIGCGLLDIRNGHIRYASAGHDAPLLRTAEGSVASLAVENGAAIGIDSSAEYTAMEIVLAPGDTLVLFTDGVTEAWMADGAQFGTERLVTVLSEAKDGSSDALLRQLLGAPAVATRPLLQLASSDTRDAIAVLTGGPRRLYTPSTALIRAALALEGGATRVATTMGRDRLLRFAIELKEQARMLMLRP